MTLFPNKVTFWVLGGGGVRASPYLLMEYNLTHNTGYPTKPKEIQQGFMVESQQEPTQLVHVFLRLPDLSFLCLCLCVLFPLSFPVSPYPLNSFSLLQAPISQTCLYWHQFSIPSRFKHPPVMSSDSKFQIPGRESTGLSFDPIFALW